MADTNWNSFAGALISKISSARFLMAISVILTLCLSVLGCLFLAYKSAIMDEKIFTLMKDIVMFILGGFMSVVTSITTLYFTRSDRSSTETLTDATRKQP